MRCATCTAVTYVELYALAKSHWDVISTHYPEVPHGQRMVNVSQP